jgi:hypothetical protein
MFARGPVRITGYLLNIRYRPFAHKLEFQDLIPEAPVMSR